MEIIRETIAEKPYTSKPFREYFGEDWCVLDIETTGLSPKYSKVILAGLAFPDGESIRAVQLFAHSRGEEEALLLKLNELLNRNRTIVTYNGASFDLPYLEYRCRACRIEPSWLPSRGLDLYRVCRYHSPLPGILPSLRQKSVEAYLGLAEERSDEISGAESVALYEEYEAFANPEERERILLHNRDDVVQLSRLLRILDKLDLHRIVYYEALAAYRGTDRSAPLVVRKIVPGRTELAVSGDAPRDAAPYYGFRSGYTFSLDRGKWKLSVPGETIGGSFVADLAEIFGADPDGDGTAETPEDALPETLRTSPQREGNYLILTAPGEVHFREMNALIRAILARN